MATTEREIEAPVLLADARGHLCDEARGFARRSLFEVGSLGRWGRRKRWDYWCVTFPGGVLQVTVAHLDYLGLLDVAFVDLETRRVASALRVLPLGVGIELPAAVEGGPIRLRTHGLRVSLAPRDRAMHIEVEARTRSGPIEADVTVEPGGDSLDVVVPWSRSRFQLTSKHVARPAHGRIVALGREHRLARDVAFGCLDYGRGRWPYRTTWNWGTAAAHVPGVGRVGVQLGGAWTDGTGATENGVFVDGRLDKIGAELRWRYDRRDFSRPWRVEDDAGDVALDFLPELVRRSRVELGVGGSLLHLAFGRWHGHVRAHGERIAIDGALGWAEEHRARW
jgi:hypothetical protein